MHLRGLFVLTNELTQVFNPAALVIFWLVFAPKTKILWLQAANWLWYPLLYLVYVIIRGAMFRFYPYPFVDADKLGYHRVAINSFFVMVAFLLFGSFLSLTIGWRTNNLNKRRRIQNSHCPLSA